ncbi:DUF1232 domain-containing protein [Tissierella creatinini]|nr:DUF1232 domain-containing protein [Tissierella creatinini]
MGLKKKVSNNDVSKKLEKNKDKIKERFKMTKKEAEEILKDKEKTEEKLNEARDKIDKLGDGPIKNAIDDLFLFISIVKAWIKGEYREIPIGTIIGIFGALIYFVSPVDVIPDFIPGIGYIDDIFIISLVVKQAHSDLQRYKAWMEK